MLEAKEKYQKTYKFHMAFIMDEELTIEFCFVFVDDIKIFTGN